MALLTINRINVQNDISEFSKIVIDTNVLFFLHGGYSQTTRERIKAGAYANLISDLIANHNEIFVSTLTLQELFHVVEDKEYKLYNATHSVVFANKKQFRADNVQRQLLKRKLLSIYSQINSLYTITDYCEIKLQDVTEFLNTYDSHKFDPLDYILAKTFNCFANVYYVTDDKDFLSKPTLEVISY